MREIAGVFLDVIGCMLSLIWTVLVVLFSEAPDDDRDAEFWW